MEGSTKSVPGPSRLATGSMDVHIYLEAALFASFVLFFLPIHPAPLQAQSRSPQEAQRTLPRLSGPKPWTDRTLYSDPRHFQFVIVSDRTGGHRDGVFQAALSKINDLRPEFVISVGDLIEGYTQNLEQIDREWKEFNGFLEPLAMRFFYVPGNHDIWDAQSRQEWEQRFGASYYQFIYKNVLFLCLNSEDGGSTQLGEEQVAFVEKTLRENSDVRWTLIFLHKALWAYQQQGRPTLWNRVDEALGGRPHTVFAGHRHQYAAHQRDNYKYYELATTGGGSSLAGPVHGRFDHVVWVTMDESGPILANLQLDGILWFGRANRGRGGTDQGPEHPLWPGPGTGYRATSKSFQRGSHSSQDYEPS